MRVSKNLFELTERCAVIPTCTATVPNILLQKMCMLSLSPLGICDAWEALEFYLLCSYSPTVIIQLNNLLPHFLFIKQITHVTGILPIGVYKLSDYKRRSYKVKS